MKRITIIMIIAVVFCSAVYSQFTVGPKVGGNYSKFAYNNKYLDTKSRYGFQIGGFVKYDVTSSWFVQSELMYARHRAFNDLKFGDYGGFILADGFTVISDYLLIPVVGGYHLGNSGFYIEAGFQPGVYLHSHYSIQSKNWELDFNKTYLEDWKSMVVSLTGGLGYDFGNGLSFSVRYCHGLTDSSLALERIGSRHRSFQFSVAYNLLSF